jgi:hypothetical protein
MGSMATFKERIDRHDREIAAIRKLIFTGMKMLGKHDQNLLRLEEEVRALTSSQRETDRQLQNLIRSLQGTAQNGHAKRPIQ